jgi:hypothetical protein
MIRTNISSLQDSDTERPETACDIVLRIQKHDRKRIVRYLYYIQKFIKLSHITNKMYNIIMVIVKQKKSGNVATYICVPFCTGISTDSSLWLIPRSVIRFLNTRNMKPADIHRQLCEVYGEHAVSDSMVRR